jgi:hypothetical protein
LECFALHNRANHLKIRIFCVCSACAWFCTQPCLFVCLFSSRRAPKPSRYSTACEPTVSEPRGLVLRLVYSLYLSYASATVTTWFGVAASLLLVSVVCEIGGSTLTRASGTNQQAGGRAQA